MKYTAINIGPIIATLGMARKPRELWSASYLFSYLMKCIYMKLQEAHAQIFSPSVVVKDIPNDVGIFPDRIYFKGDIEVESILDNAKGEFVKNVGLRADEFDNYFNIMSATCDAGKDADAIAKLNQRLDVMELCNYAADKDATVAINKIISPYRKQASKLYKLATGRKFEMDSLAEISTAELREKDSQEWEDARNEAETEGKVLEKLRKELAIIGKEIPEDLLFNWDDFYDKLGKSFVTEVKNEKGEVVKTKSLLKSYHKYFCVVQADGDNVGKTISHKDLLDEDVSKVSMALVGFGGQATEIIKAYGGFPIYAGGDDLLFIAPVKGKDHSNIFNLLEKIENEAFNGVRDAVNGVSKGNGIEDDDGKKIEASLSYGVSITYYKYPLYEALESARELLFGKAKELKDSNGKKQKKAVAWSLRKHSGGTYEVVYSRKKTELCEQFEALIGSTTTGDTVSAVAHKIRENETLIDMVLEDYLKTKDDSRLNALFEKVLELDNKKEKYFKAVKDIMPTLYDAVGKEQFPQALYSLLRIAKFINGEDLRDE